MTHPPQQRPWQLSWRPEPPAEERSTDPVQALQELSRNRVLDAQSLVRAASAEVLAWLLERPENWMRERAWRELGRLLQPLSAAHGWRGAVALWLGTLERQCSGAGDEPSAPIAQVLSTEVGLWLGGMDEIRPGHPDWDGAPGTPGERLPSPERCAAGPLTELGQGEIVAVHGDSPAVASALLQACDRGLRPTAYVSEGGPELGGRRLAEELSDGGVRVVFHYDSALVARLGHVDRVWLGTEAVGAQDFIGLVGTRHLLREARRLEVPATLLTTSDSLIPGGGLQMPAWGKQSPWLLWESPPSGVEVEGQPFEAVPLALVGQVADEHGMGRPAELAVRALRTEEAGFPASPERAPAALHSPQVPGGGTQWAPSPPATQLFQA